VSNILDIANMFCGYNGTQIIKGISFNVALGEFVGIVGPNGCGKTTLLRALSGILRPSEGEIKIGNTSLSLMSQKELAQKIAFVPQMLEPVDGFTVEELVLLGRTPHLNRFAFESEEDYEITKWAVDQLQIERLQDIPITHLSGGEFKRVMIARALAQEPKILLLDEPTSHLDLRFQIKIMRLLKRLRQSRSVIATFHDLNLATKFCQRLVLIKKGELIAQGPPDEVITAENIWKAYRIKVEVKKNPRTKRARYVILP
jgi:iron complex transport system ATP-binding protein